MTDPQLEVIDSLGHRVVVIGKMPFAIGRRSSNDLILSGTDVSRDHAEIFEVDGRYAIRDRGSRSGTMVNGSAITEQRLANGDRIRIGRTAGAELIFRLDHTSVGDLPSSAVAAVGFRQVAALLDALRALGSSRVLDEVLLLVMDAAIAVTGAERGFIMLANQSGELELKLARLQGKVSLSGSRFETSRKIPEQVFASGQPRIVADLRDGDLAQSHGGTVALGRFAAGDRRTAGDRRPVSRQSGKGHVVVRNRPHGAGDARRRSGRRHRERAPVPRGERESAHGRRAAHRVADPAVAPAAIEKERWIRRSDGRVHALPRDWR
jgi:hypothetical protein